MTTNYTRPEYDAYLPKWTRVRDAVAGEDAVKAKTTDYLPDPDETNVTDPTGCNHRYKQYLRRAVYYNATGRTLSGLVGVAFANWPQIELGTHKGLLQDVDGSGVGIVNQAQWLLSDVLQTGRAGLLADFTRLDEATRKRIRTVADAEAAGVRAVITAYAAESILTWETQGTTLTRVVLKESATEYEGGEVQQIPQLRELVLIGGKYSVNIWQKRSEAGQYLQVDKIDVGLPYIPFAFVGATNNDQWPDQPPLLDLANMNLHHYRNSADYEESAFLMGQPQFIVSGVDEEWRLANPSVTFGSRSALCLPANADAKLAQVAPNTLAKEAMDTKQEQMQQLGARLLGKGEATKTATQSASETKASYSVLSLACDNVSAAYTRALQWLNTWGRTGLATKVGLSIDTQFNDLTLDANAIRETVAAWQAGLVPQSDAWTVLRRLNVIDQAKTDEQLRGEIEAQGPALNLDEAA